MNEIVLIPCYNRPELLFICLSLIRSFESTIRIRLFPDRGSRDAFLGIAEMFKAELHYTPDHDYYGNSYNTMEAYRWAYNAGADLAYLVEDDIFVHHDFFAWHRKMHEEYDDIFGAMAWIFNRHAPIMEGEMFQPWFYSIGVSFTRQKLALLAKHATPLYYQDMPGYIRKHFKSNPLNDPFNIMHVEQDGLIQRILDDDKTQTVSPGIAKCSHMGFGGYNRGWNTYEKFFEGVSSFDKRLDKVMALYEDPYWRMSIFGRAIVEREIGYAIPERTIRYRIELPGGWETEFVSEMTQEHLPKRIHSAPIPEGSKVELLL